MWNTFLKYKISYTHRSWFEFILKLKWIWLYWQSSVDYESNGFSVQLMIKRKIDGTNKLEIEKTIIYWLWSCVLDRSTILNFEMPNRNALLNHESYRKAVKRINKLWWPGGRTVCVCVTANLWNQLFLGIPKPFRESGESLKFIEFPQNP